MENQKIINLLENASNKASKFTTKNWVEINDESSVAYNVNSKIKFKTIMLKSKGAITVDDISTAGAAANNTNKNVIFKN